MYGPSLTVRVLLALSASALATAAKAAGGEAWPRRGPVPTAHPLPPRLLPPALRREGVVGA